MSSNSHCPPTTFFLDVGLVAREGGHLHVDVLEGDRVDGARDAVDVGRVGHRLSEDGWFDGRAHQIWIWVDSNYLKSIVK